MKSPTCFRHKSPSYERHYYKGILNECIKFTYTMLEVNNDSHKYKKNMDTIDGVMLTYS